MADLGNVFAGLPLTTLPDEVMTDLLATPNLRIECIVSTGQATPIDRWYDQDWNEWVILLRGGAQMLFEGKPEPQSLGPGDYVNISAHRRHRVVWTDPDEATVWLAVHYR
jgi:cupin 2 domain-containing protein